MVTIIVELSVNNASHGDNYCRGDYYRHLQTCLSPKCKKLDIYASLGIGNEYHSLT